MLFPEEYLMKGNRKYSEMYTSSHHYGSGEYGETLSYPSPLQFMSPENGSDPVHVESHETAAATTFKKTCATKERSQSWYSILTYSNISTRR